MRKPDLAAIIADKADIPANKASDVLSAILDEITNSLSRKESVSLIGLAQGREEGLGEGMEKGREEGREEGLDEGMEKGREEALHGVAQQLLTVLDDATIAEKTGLSEAAVAQLRKDDAV